MSGRDRIAHELLKCIFRLQAVRPLTLAQTLGRGLGASAVRSWCAVRNLCRSRNSARYAQSTRLKIAQLAVQNSAAGCIVIVDVDDFSRRACIHSRDQTRVLGWHGCGHNNSENDAASQGHGQTTSRDEAD